LYVGNFVYYDKGEVQMKSNNIGVVIVTFNRLKQLKIALSAYDKQSCRPKYVVVVNNNSDDGTLEYLLNEWSLDVKEYSKYVINLKVNTGGSGGFYEGLKKSLELDADWIWVADDDAYPDISAIETADACINDKSIVNNQISAICGMVIKNDNIDCMHRRRIFTNKLKICEVPVPIEEYNNKLFELDLFSYVGTIVNKSVLRQVGLPKKGYFIFYDDIEHSMRFAQKGKIFCFPAIKIIHDAQESKEQITWKQFYLWRNQFDFYKTHFLGRYLWIYFSQKIRAQFHILCNKDALKYKIKLEALNDSCRGKLGMHEVYKPGWKNNK